MKRSFGKALLVGALMGGVAAMAPSCGQTRRPVACNAMNCPGCCDDNQQCLTGLSDALCGNSGASCAACPSGQTCTAQGPMTGGRCLAGGTGGGAAATGGGTVGAGGGSSSAGGNGGGSIETGGGTAGDCSPQNCADGCCNASGICVRPGVTAQCGTGGAMCMPCSFGNTCVNGACTPCNGCINVSTGACQPGTSDTECGKPNTLCANCTNVAGASCQNQTCSSTSAMCNATNCAGCCDGDRCVSVPMQSPNQCGQGAPGALCQQCASGRCDTAADAGACVPAMPGLDGGFFPPIFGDGGFPPIFGDGGIFGGKPCSATMPCGQGECCNTLLGSMQCAQIGAPPVSGFPLGQVCGLSGMMCTATCTFPRPFGPGATCNAMTGMCQ